MKRIFRISLYAFLLLAGAACTRHKIIPDEKLAQIFHDAFLTNAYIGDERVNIDSLNIYEPIFARYGYTTRDVYYTIGNFSKRKSARLGDVVEMAIEKLEAEGKFYDREVAVLDTIDNVGRRTFTRTVYADSLIRVGALARYGAPADRRRRAARRVRTAAQIPRRLARPEREGGAGRRLARKQGRQAQQCLFHDAAP